MKTVIFTIKETVSSKRQDALIARVRAWQKVSGVGRITYNTKSPGFRMIWVAFEESADINAALKKLRSYKSVESADVPAPRHLA